LLPDEVHPLGVLLQGIQGAKTLPHIQKCVDNNIQYRAKHLKEKIGKGGPISALFSEFKNMRYLLGISV